MTCCKFRTTSKGKFLMTKWLTFTSLVILLVCGNKHLSANVYPPYYSVEAEQWADSVFNTLTRDERIAQLIMVSAYSNKDFLHVMEIKNLVEMHKIGGLIFFQ